MKQVTNTIRREKKKIGLAFIGCGTIGRIRGILAKEFPGIRWTGLCDICEDLGCELT